MEETLTITKSELHNAIRSFVRVIYAVISLVIQTAWIYWVLTLSWDINELQEQVKNLETNKVQVKGENNERK